MLTVSLLRAHWKDLLASLLALTLGVGISAAALLVFSSARPEVPTDLAATAAVVRAPAAGKDAEQYTEYLPWAASTADALVADLSAQPGVASAVPVHSFYAQLVLDGEPAGTPDPDALEGRGWSSVALAPYALTAGNAPARADEVAVSDSYDVRVGQQVPVLTVSGERAMTVTGTVDGPGIYVSDTEARSISGGATLIGVVAEPGTDTHQLARTLTTAVPPGAALLTGDDRAAAESEATTRTRYLGTQLLSMMLVLTVFSAVFVTSQTFALAAAHRRRDVALLRALGGSPGQIQRMLLAEAAVVGLLGSVLGVGVGLACAPLLGTGLVAAGLEPTGFAVRNSPLVLSALAIGPVLAVVATWTAARRSAWVAPLEAIRGAQPGTRPIGRWRLLAGGLAAVGAVAAAIAAATAEASQISSVASTATLLAVAAITLLGPLVLPPLVRLLTWPLTRGRRAGGMLVRGAMTTAVSRTTSTMAPILATVALATLVLGYVETGRGAYGGQDLPADTSAVVAPDGAPGLPEDTVSRTLALADGPVKAPLQSQVFTGVPPVATPSVGVAEVPEGTAVASRELAERNGWSAGQDVVVTLPDGVEVQLRLTTVAANQDAVPIALPRSLLREHDAVSLTPRLLLTDMSPKQLQSVTGPGVRVQSAAEYASAGDEEEYGLLRTFALVAMGLALGYTLLAIVNTLLMATSARLRDLRLLRLSGATPRQVTASLFGESLVTVLLGSVLGLAAGLTGVLGVRSGLAREMDRSVPLALPWAWVAALVLLCALLAGIAGAWPSWRMLRRAPSSMTSESA